jgi:transcriptional regulator with XRE-family HTH domain
MKNRPTFEAFKEKALQREGVRTEYNELQPVYELKAQMIQARLSANLTQGDVAELLHTKKSNISRLESLSTKHLPNLATIIEYANVVGFKLEINFKKLLPKKIENGVRYWE